MNLTQIKAMLGIPTGGGLDLSNQLDQTTNQPTGWMRNWNNATRNELLIGPDVLAEVKKDMSLKTLTLKSETRISKDTEKDGITTPGQPYTRHYLIISKDIAETW